MVCDKDLIQQNIISLTYNYKCVYSTSPTYDVDIINNMDVIINTNGELKELTCFIDSI